MVWKVMVVMVIFLMMIFSFIFVLDDLDIDPIELKVNYLEPGTLNITKYGAVPVFTENMRFNHNLISYTIMDGCDEERRSDMVAAFNIFSEKVKVISFYEVGKDGDIKISCSNEFIDLGESLFAAGEGGPSRIINTSGFKVIEEGEVILYNSADCSYPVVALHELCHVFGFDHSGDPNNIMYNTSSCGQRMSDDIVNVMVELYSIEALGDARVESIEGEIRGRYLDFNISVLNEGLIEIDGINLTILSSKDGSGDWKIVDVVDLGEIEVGYGRTLKVVNMRIDSGVEIVRFVIDAGDLVREIREDNNVIEMRV